MSDLTTAFTGFSAIGAAALVTWAVSVRKRDISIIDAMWGPFLLLALLAYLYSSGAQSERALVVLVLTAAWAARLSAHIAWRSRGQPEDRRYRAIRERNEPHFEWKSLYLVFGLQTLLAWIVSWSLLGAVSSTNELTALDYIAAALWLFGLAYEATADLQLTRFKGDPRNAGRVMDAGLWRYSRHPNYFGECVIWWAAYLFALSAGAWWALLSPVLMTLMLVRFTGAALLESDIAERRPGYAAYIARTNAFLPGPPRRIGTETPHAR